MDAPTAAAKRLKEAGLRPTRFRERTLEALWATDAALSHKDLVSRLPDLDRVTIFRCIKQLRKSSLLHKVRGTDGVSRFVANRTSGSSCPGNHPHFFCLSCGALTCLEGLRLPHLELPTGFEVRGKQFLVEGICPGCAQGRATAAGPDEKETSS
jgi:Fur family ferric uptake transcriptional regulator/Fur family zinc uptake transcriptional regulator